MPKPLIVRVLGEDSKFLATLKRDAAASSKFEQQLLKTSVTAKQSAEAQVAASLKKDARLREEIALYRQIATSAERGSREQVVAANLAQRAEARLARSMGVTASEARGLSAATGRFNRDLSAATRGAAAGSGIFRGLGHSIVFASGGFLAFTTAGAFLRKSIDAAKEAQVTEAQLEQQFKNNRRSIEPYRQEIDRVTNSLSALSGFENDELKAALTTILRTQPNVNKALRDTATAADLARAKHLGLAQSAIIVAKVEAGNTTLLRRQGIQIPKNAKAEEALAILRQKVAGQARAGTTEQERFGAVLHNTEEIIGTGVLPTLNEYLARGSVWLEQMNESGKLQRDVAHGAQEISSAVHDAAAVIHTIDGVTGSFKNTLELLLALKVGRWAVGVAGSLRLIGTAETVAAGEAVGLRAALLSLSGPEIVTGLAAVYGSIKLIQNATKHTTVAPASFGPQVRTGERIDQVQNDITFLRSLGQTDSKLFLTLTALEREMQRSGSVLATADQVVRAQQQAARQIAANAAITGGAAKHAALAANAARRAAEAAATAAGAASAGVTFTAAQRNTFFDNAIARILMRGGLGDIQTQIAALTRADALIQRRLAVTKDVTRRLRLEDELLQNQAQIRSLKAEQAATAAQAAQDAHQKLVDALAARADARKARQFRELGFTATGEDVIPGVARLKRELASIDKQVDTPALEAKLARIRKVLGEGIVPRDVRSRIQEMFDQIRQGLEQGTSQNLTAWRHLSSQTFLAGVPDLTAAQKRILANRLSVLGPGGGVPPTRTAAFALAGRTSDAHNQPGDVYMDGEKVGRITHSHNISRGRKRTVPRSG